MKKCKRCKIEKLRDEFSKRPINSDGLYSYCKECVRKENRERFQRNRDLFLKKQGEYREKNRDSLNEKSKIYYKKNRKICLEKSKIYREKNKKKISISEANRRIKDENRFEKNNQKHLQWAKNNREKLSLYQRIWYKKNREKRRAHVRLIRAVNSGRIIRPICCSECKKLCKPDGHHVDYEKPLEVIWLCRACHSRKSPRTVLNVFSK